MDKIPGSFYVFLGMYMLCFLILFAIIVQDIHVIRNVAENFKIQIRVDNKEK